MSRDLAFVIADAFRLRAIRLASPFACRVLYYTDSNLVSAFESVRANEPRMVALESHFAHSAEGRAFVDRLQRLDTADLEVHVISFVNGEWVTSLPGPIPAVVAETGGATNTRRVPRFPLLNPLALDLDGQKTSLVNLSVMGAQVVSAPVLRPSQRLKIRLLDDDESFLSVRAQVAWATFETSIHAEQPYYRAGIEFADAALQTLEEYCKRHCIDEPLLPTR